MSRDPAVVPHAGVVDAVAPAKVNLGLRIVARRADGMHELESVFAPLDWHDSLAIEIEPARETAVELRLAAPAAGVPEDDTNLAARAARAFLDAAGATAAVRIQLEKRVPHGAGLGGGSSDAAAVLRSLARHLPGALSDARLADVALGLGADVPFFLRPHPALVRGVGERIEPLPGLPSLPLLLSGPDATLATAAVYAAYDALHPSSAGVTPDARPPLALWGASGDREAERSARLAALLENDLEPAAVRLCPPLARLRERIRSLGALAVGMSGSGPTVFGVFGDRSAAEAACAAMAHGAAGWVRVATTRDSG